MMGPPPGYGYPSAQPQGGAPQAMPGAPQPSWGPPVQQTGHYGRRWAGRDILLRHNFFLVTTWFALGFHVVSCLQPPVHVFISWKFTSFCVYLMRISFCLFLYLTFSWCPPSVRRFFPHLLSLQLCYMPPTEMVQSYDFLFSLSASPSLPCESCIVIHCSSEKQQLLSLSWYDGLIMGVRRIDFWILDEWHNKQGYRVGDR